MPVIHEEREQLRADLLERKKPKRLPIMAKFQIEAACGYAGIDLKKALYDPELMEKACAAICADFYSDTFPMVNMRFPWSFQMLGGQNWVVSSTGAIQHPEVENMRPEWYDEFIEDPIGTIVEKILPNTCKALDINPLERGLVLSKAYSIKNKESGYIAGMSSRLTAKYEYMTPLMTGPRVPIPYDNLADKFRGFKGIMMDMRRVPDKVKAAINVLLPIAKYIAMSRNVKPGMVSFVPLHMPPYISTKAFDELYWPTFEEMILFMDRQGVAVNVFAEGDWSRYYEHMSRLPVTTSFQMEEGDWAAIKKSFGREHVFGGLYDPTITLTRTKEECIDEAKRLFEICGEGGRFYFCFNRNVMDINSIDSSKLRAVLDWVHTKAVYY